MPGTNSTNNSIDCPLSSTVPVRYRTIDDGLDEALSKAREWLEQCDENHKCIEICNSEIPTRVLAIDQQLGLVARLM
jgi:hypothetical protein